MPDYLGGLQSALLNQDATLFRRKYFLNGAHMGFIFYATDPHMDDDTEEEMKEMIASSKGWETFAPCSSTSWPASFRPMAGEGSGIPRSTMPPMPATRCCRCVSLSRMPSTARDSLLPAGRFSGEYRFSCINKQYVLWQDRLLIWIKKGA